MLRGSLVLLAALGAAPPTCTWRSVMDRIDEAQVCPPPELDECGPFPQQPSDAAHWDVTGGTVTVTLDTWVATRRYVDAVESWRVCAYNAGFGCPAPTNGGGPAGDQ